MISIIERQIVQFLKVQDELVLKTVLDSLRVLIMFMKETNSKSQFNLSELAPIVNLKDDNDDFFHCFLGIKMKQRQKSFKMLVSRIQSGLLKDFKTIHSVILPLINYTIFGGKAQKYNRRNTITYNAEQKR